MKRYLLGVDAGTTSFKGALFDENRTQLAAAQRDYALLTPQADWVEFPAEEYWKIFCALTRELLERAEVCVEDVLALALSSQGETLICLDEAGRPLGNAIVWLDNRAAAQAHALRERFGVRSVYEVSGQADMLATWPAAKILWLRENRPEQFQKTRKFLLLEDYLLYRLTGRTAGEPNLWASSAMLNIHTAQWWPEMLEALGIAPERLPEIRPCGSVLSTAAHGAREAGLAPGTLAVLGALDQTCNAIGCGITRPGMICETTGSCLAVSAVLDTFIPYDARMPVTCQNHAVPGRYTVLLWSQSAGMTLKWFARNFYSEEESLDCAFERINVEAAKVPAGCEGLTMLPHLTGAANPEYDSAARGAFVGATLEHGRAHFARAVMEAVACMLRRNMEQLEALGAVFDRIYCMGGGAKSPLWLQIKADITGKNMLPLRAQESACLGAAILAGVGAGVFESIDLPPVEKESADQIYPERKNAAACEELYGRYIRLYEALKPYFAENARARRGAADGEGNGGEK